MSTGRGRPRRGVKSMEPGNSVLYMRVSDEAKTQFQTLAVKYELPPSYMFNAFVEFLKNDSDTRRKFDSFLRKYFAEYYGYALKSTPGK